MLTKMLPTATLTLTTFVFLSKHVMIEPGSGWYLHCLSAGMQNQQGVGEPDPDLRKQEGLRIILEKTYGGDVLGESQNLRSPDNENHS